MLASKVQPVTLNLDSGGAGQPTASHPEKGAGKMTF